MSKIILYHNPRCSKSREALRLLTEAGHDPQIIDYQKTPLTEKQLDQLKQKLNCTWQEMLRHKEDIYKSLKLSEADDKALRTALATHPILLERPIVVAGDRALIARPPEQLENWLI